MNAYARSTVFVGVMALVSGLLSGCDALEPYNRPFAWRPTGANESNLAAMAVNPTDLVRGRGTSNADGRTAAAAIDRLLNDRLKPLNGGLGPSAASLSAN